MFNPENFFYSSVFFRPFGAWRLQRDEERAALKNWQKLWATNAKGGSGDHEREVQEMATNYLRRGSHTNFVEKFIAAKHLAREKKKSLKDERAKMRAEKKKALETESREVEENLTRKCSFKSRRREEKKKRKEVEVLERQHMRDEDMRREKEERRRMRIEELNSAQVS